MKLRVPQAAILQRPAGPRLRCFLRYSWLLLIILLVMSVEFAYAQLTILKPIHVWRVQGYVTDKSGRPIADAEVTLVTKDQLVTFKTKTDGFGRFKFDHVAGQYWLRADAPRYSTAARNVAIGKDLRALFNRGSFYMMLGPIACMDDCSPVYTSKKNFDYAVRWNTGHFY